MYTLLNKDEVKSNRMKVFCINGISLAGKDSFCRHVNSRYNNLHNKYNRANIQVISSIDPVKEIYAKFFGWDGTKTPVHRKNLNILKNIWVQVNDGPSRWLENELAKASDTRCSYLFVMVREFSEMLKMQHVSRSLGYQAFTLNIVREGIPIPPIEQEFLDSHPHDYRYDIIVNNPTVDSYPDVPKLDESAYIFCNFFGE